MLTFFKKTISALIFIGCFSSCYKSEKADLVVHNATIYSVDEGFSQHQAMAIRDGKILELGPEHEILNRYKAKKTVDAAKKFVYPGFIDAHSHFMGFAKNKGELNLFGVGSEAEMMEKVQAWAAAHPEGWISGRGWDQTTWLGAKWPTNTLLDSLFPSRPVYLGRVDGHAALVNSAAIAEAQLSPDQTVHGGAFLRDSLGVFTGIILDMVVERVQNAKPEPNANLLGELLIEAQEDCFAAGLTMVTDAGLTVQEIGFLDTLQRAGELQMPIYAMIAPGSGALEFMANGPFLTERLNVRSVKLYADGALGSRGALLKSPYSDDHENTGLLLLDDSVFNVYAEACYQYGYQLCTHCIGDSANALTLRKYANVLQEMTDRRWRIEHAQVVSDSDIHLFGDFGIIPSVQPTHAISDMRWAEQRLGSERVGDAYRLQTLKNQIGILALGTDFPVEDISPIMTFYTAVFRKAENGEHENRFQMDESLTREEALRGITLWSALSMFEENRMGSLEPGKLANFVILDRDLLTAPEATIPETRVLSTYLFGEKVAGR